MKKERRWGKSIPEMIHENIQESGRYLRGRYEDAIIIFWLFVGAVFLAFLCWVEKRRGSRIAGFKVPRSYREAVLDNVKNSLVFYKMVGLGKQESNAPDGVCTIGSDGIVHFGVEDIPWSLAAYEKELQDDIKNSSVFARMVGKEVVLNKFRIDFQTWKEKDRERRKEALESRFGTNTLIERGSYVRKRENK